LLINFHLSIGTPIMNFKSILVLGLSVATLGLSVPAHADDNATVVESNQNAVVTGSFNDTNQSNKTRVTNTQSGRRTTGNTGTAVTNNQNVDVLGDANSTKQDNDTTVRNSQRRPAR
jgi:hypothetical protein